MDKEQDGLFGVLSECTRAIISYYMYIVLHCNLDFCDSLPIIPQSSILVQKYNLLFQRFFSHLLRKLIKYRFQRASCCGKKRFQPLSLLTFR